MAPLRLYHMVEFIYATSLTTLTSMHQFRGRRITVVQHCVLLMWKFASWKSLEVSVARQVTWQNCHMWHVLLTFSSALWLVAFPLSGSLKFLKINNSVWCYRKDIHLDFPSIHTLKQFPIHIAATQIIIYALSQLTHYLHTSCHHLPRTHQFLL